MGQGGEGKSQPLMASAQFFTNCLANENTLFQVDPPSVEGSLMTICFYSKYCWGMRHLTSHSRSLSKYLLPTTDKCVFCGEGWYFLFVCLFLQLVNVGSVTLHFIITHGYFPQIMAFIKTETVCWVQGSCFNGSSEYNFLTPICCSPQ